MMYVMEARRHAQTVLPQSVTGTIIDVPIGKRGGMERSVLRKNNAFIR